MAGRSPRKALCHPERPHLAKGLCGNCYQRWTKHREPSLTIHVHAFAEIKKASITATAHRAQATAPYRPSNTYLKKRERVLKCRYGIDLEEYNALLKIQNGGCAVCLKSTNRPLCVDHCHVTGKVRGLLCHSCNRTMAALDLPLEIFQRFVKYKNALPISLQEAGAGR